MASRGGIVWPQLLPSRMLGGVNWHLRFPRGEPPACDKSLLPVPVSGKGLDNRHHGEREGTATGVQAKLSAFSLVEDRLLCR